MKLPPQTTTASPRIDRAVPATKTETKSDATATTETTATTLARPKSDVFVATQGASAAQVKGRARLDGLLQKLGLERTGDQVRIRGRVAQNIRGFVDDLTKRERQVVDHTLSAMRAMGYAATHVTTFNDLRQLKDFAELAIANKKPLEVFSPLVDVAWFVGKYPDEARRILKFLDDVEADTWKQPSAWMKESAKAGGAARVGDAHKALPAQADVVVIGGGLSAGAVARNFADSAKTKDSKQRSVLILERDGKTKDHAASLRNAGIVCTALDYVFGIDEAIGEKPIDRIAEALSIPHAEAEVVYASLVHVMGDATKRLQEFVKSKNVDVDLKTDGGLDIAASIDDLEELRQAAHEAKALGLDWTVVDAEYLKEEHGIESDEVAGALKLNDSGQLHPGKLVKALFDYAQKTTPSIAVEHDVEVKFATPRGDQEGWLLHTNRGVIAATDVIDAREAFAPYEWREKRYSQIHIIDVPKGDAGPMGLGDVNVCSSLTYMRKVEDGKFMVGSGDFPIKDTEKTPKPLASIALYAAACFKKVYPDVPFEISKVWGGVFGRSKDDLPVAGELAKGWHVIGGAGGSGLNLTPAMAQQTVNNILGKNAEQPFSPAEDFSPRRFFVRELRFDLARALSHLPEFAGTPIEKLRVEILSGGDGPGARSPVRDGDELTFFVDESVLDDMNPDLLAFLGSPLQALGGRGVEAAARGTVSAANRGPTVDLPGRERVKARWIEGQVALIEQGKRASSMHISDAPARPPPLRPLALPQFALV